MQSPVFAEGGYWLVYVPPGSKPPFSLPGQSSEQKGKGGKDVPLTPTESLPERQSGEIFFLQGDMVTHREAERTLKQNWEMIRSHVMYRGENLSVYNFQVTGPLTTKFMLDKMRLCYYLEGGAGMLRMQCNLGYILAKVPFSDGERIETRYFYCSGNTSIFNKPTIEIAGARSFARIKRLLDSKQPIEETLMNDFENSQWVLLAIVNMQLIFYHSKRNKKK